MILKDVQLLLRDRGRLLSLFLLPVVFMVVFGSMFKFGPDRGEPRPIPVYNARPALALASLGEGFTIEAAPTAEAVRQAVASGDRVAGLVIPETGPVELVIDLAGPVQVRGPVQGALTAAVMRALAPPIPMPALIEAKSPPGIAKPLDTISSFQVTVPGNAVLFGFFLSMTVAMTFASERRSGTWRRLLAAPVPRWKALVGTLVPYFVIGCVQMLFLFDLGAFAFDMKIAGSLVGFVVLSLAVVLCAVCLGLLFASIGGTEKQIGSTAPVVLLVMGLLGGCMFPRIAMPEFMKNLGRIVPHSWALDGYYDVLVRQGTSLADLAPSIGALCGFAALFALLGLWRFRFE
ncbi:MAG TPA: ABC transporter permease [Kofleriaceae bacterium]|nr:ABC transporter permease [Kofleriaceae bacterium]